MRALLKDENMDVTLLVGPEEKLIKAHGIILKVSSPMLNAAITTKEWVEAQGGTVKLPSLSPEAVLRVCELMYTGELRINSDQECRAALAQTLQLYIDMENALSYLAIPLATNDNPMLNQIRFELGSADEKVAINCWKIVQAGKNVNYIGMVATALATFTLFCDIIPQLVEATEEAQNVVLLLKKMPTQDPWSKYFGRDSVLLLWDVWCNGREKSAR
ncbi:hypothetical protein HDV00_001005 [Rhizophlyctis rosea]|nr:hypothetical protein HDV00_001005 [Rhizophlyctis rosea]